VIWSHFQKRWVKFLATLLILGALFFTLDSSKFVDAIFRIEPWWMTLGVALSFIFVALRMLKWKLLANSNGLHASGLVLVRCMLFALALGIITPGRIGEAVAIMPFAPPDRGKTIVAYVYDRIGELATVILFCVPATFMFVPVWGSVLALALAFGSLGMIFLLNSQRLRPWITGKLPEAISGRLAKISEASIHAPARYWLLSIVIYIVTYASIAAFVAGADPNMTLKALLVLPVVTLSNLVTITIGGLGIREGLAALVSPAAGLIPEVTAAAFFLSFFWTRLLPGLVGAIWTMAAGYKFR
jgi:glycosyltransferase 2 family protein